MSKLLFAPVRVLAGVVAGLIGRVAFARLWAVLDRQAPPEPEDRDAPWGKLVLALALRAAISGAVRGMLERASRAGFSKLTGAWPGEDRSSEAQAPARARRRSPA